VKLDGEQLRQWEQVVNDVSKEHIPLHCVKKIILRLGNRKQKTINIDALRRNGAEINEIDTIVGQTLYVHKDSIVNIDFIIDVASVAEIIQPFTDKLLKNL
jgi:hypothetical protein